MQTELISLQHKRGTGEASLAGGAGRGAIAGLAATVPMTGAMLALGALARRGKQPPFPPRRVAAELTKRVSLWQHMDERQRNMLTLVSHFGYGATAGALYGAYATRRPTAATSGVAYGLLIWAASYAGWLPALHILPPPWCAPRRRTFQMIAAHLVWGLSLGWLLRRR